MLMGLREGEEEVYGEREDKERGGGGGVEGKGKQEEKEEGEGGLVGSPLREE